ncbi:PHB depolymerase family esterase [Marinivivus vitaminiproducens]|uniref:PHB depolymerase family esterase n=1 Tax=Marinivivus vitaminiproducens TaxID=3035935 RepID=UPI0027A6AF73|nr:PHB depolymerase family esterase [Geminicoccaceae bacterium SCSIO 64248]
MAAWVDDNRPTITHRHVGFGFGETYPDLYAALGVHSGLAYSSASDVVSAFAAMRGDGGIVPKIIRRGGKPSDAPAVRTIVFHGSADRTVHPANAQRIVAAASSSGETRREHGRAPGGRVYERTVVVDVNDRPLVESWLIAAGSPRSPTAKAFTVSGCRRCVVRNPLSDQPCALRPDLDECWFSRSTHS